ncbi:MAG TPA: hypothetical protein VE439_08335 [Anaerolineae bacterium]|nr:hypothetical protein [Anaerolineae bacterium]
MKQLSKKSLVGVLVFSFLALASAFLIYGKITSAPPDEKEMKKGYTESELVAKGDEVAQDLEKYGVKGPSTLDVNSADQKLELTVPQISDDAKQALQEKYGDLLVITVDKDFRYEKF